MKLSSTLPLLAAAALFAAPSHAKAQSMNLLINGDFSAPANTTQPYGYAGTPAATAVPGWTLSGGNEGVVGPNNSIALGPNYWTPNSYQPGNDSATYPYFAFIQGDGTITQSISLVVGDSYTLSLAAAVRAENTPIAVVSVLNPSGQVIAGGTPLNQPDPSFLTDGFSSNGTYTFDFVPDTAGLYTIVLASSANGGDNTEDYTAVSLIDNDAPTLGVPEPSTYALLGVGALGLCFVGRRSLKTA